MGRYEDVFTKKKSIIGMIHLGGRDSEEKMQRAFQDLTIYDEEGVDGAIIEDYHGTIDDVLNVLFSSGEWFNLIRGVNILSDPYQSFQFAENFGAAFVQFDSVQSTDLDIENYNRKRNYFKSPIVLGGVGFKYTNPTRNPLEKDLNEAREICEAIVTTGSGTGIETPIDKLREYKNILGDFPFIVGAGVTLENVAEQLEICDGAIIGSYFKPNGDTNFPVERDKVRKLMDVVGKL